MQEPVFVQHFRSVFLLVGHQFESHQESAVELPPNLAVRPKPRQLQFLENWGHFPTES